MNQERFERLVRRALSDLPADFQAYLDDNNVDLLVEEWPSREQLLGTGLEEDQMLLGLYEGVPLTEREDYNMVLPDRIYIFKGPLEKLTNSEEELIEEIRETVRHEVAHHFGIDDPRLEELGHR